MIKTIKKLFRKKPEVKLYEPEDLGITFEIYKSKKNKKWYFRAKAKNGKTICSSRQAYENKSDCLSTIELIQKGAYMSKTISVM